MSTTASKATPSLLHLFLSPFSENTKENTNANPHLRGAYESVSQLNELFGEKNSLSGLIKSERIKLVELDEKLTKTDADRIDALTEYRISGDEGAKQRAEQLLGECTAIRQELSDVEAVAGAIEAKISAIESRIANLKITYSRDIGMFLDSIYVRLAEHYNQVAPEVAEMALQLAALQNVMMRYLAGRSSGFERRIYLPACVPFEGKTLEPIIDAGVRKFSDGANARMEAILTELKNAGFIWRFN